jgi:NADH:ubiquinone oxidoreductase subunit 5 (subunit L)/multisubunit Na+/H+ antiporter MnhA subunit
MYQLSDFTLLIAASFASYNLDGVIQTNPIVATALIFAALMKSSQFPLIALFARSMEGIYL